MQASRLRYVKTGYHSRGYLPHLKAAGAAYFVTFRLADSLPRDVVLRLKEQRHDLLRHAAETRCSDLESMRRELFAWYASELDAVLDQHSGCSVLRKAAVADLLATALRHFNQQRYQLHAWCVMPNHVHAVLRPLGEHSLEAILHSWKSFTAHEVNRVLARTGELWQRESYDHWIRDDGDLAHCCHYTELNPVKAGLCRNASDWAWSSAAKK